jgi:hypothetical protein
MGLCKQSSGARTHFSPSPYPHMATPGGSAIVRLPVAFMDSQTLGDSGRPELPFCVLSDKALQT